MIIWIQEGKKELLIKELEWCNNHISNLVNTANVLYQKYISGEKFAARKQCLDFKKMEFECNKYNSKMAGKGMAEKFLFQGDRRQVREQAAGEAYRLALKRIEDGE